MRPIFSSIAILCIVSLTSACLLDDDPCAPEAPEQVQTLTTTSQVKAIQGCKTLKNGFTIIGNQGGMDDLETIEFPNLENAERGLTIELVPNLRSISLPRLERMSLPDGQGGGSLWINQNRSLRTISAPLFELLGVETETLGSDGILVSVNPELESVDFSSLRHLTGDVTFQQNGLLSELQFPQLVFVKSLVVVGNGVDSVALPKIGSMPGGIRVEDNLLLSSFAAPLLESSGTLNFNGNPALDTLALSSLTGLGRFSLTASKLVSLELDLLASTVYFQVEGNADLAGISAAALTSVGESGMTISTNEVLVDLNFPSLASVDGNLRIGENPSLPDCEALLLYDQIGESRQGAGVNKGDGCP